MHLNPVFMIFNFLELSDSERRVGIGWHAENSLQVVPEVGWFTSHGSTSSSTLVGGHFVKVCAAASPQAVRVQCFNEILDSHVVIADCSCRKNYF